MSGLPGSGWGQGEVGWAEMELLGALNMALTLRGMRFTGVPNGGRLHKDNLDMPLSEREN